MGATRLVRSDCRERGQRAVDQLARGAGARHAPTSGACSAALDPSTRFHSPAQRSSVRTCTPRWMAGRSHTTMKDRMREMPTCGNRY